MDFRSGPAHQLDAADAWSKLIGIRST